MLHFGIIRLVHCLILLVMSTKPDSEWNLLGHACQLQLPRFLSIILDETTHTMSCMFIRWRYTRIFFAWNFIWFLERYHSCHATVRWISIFAPTERNSVSSIKEKYPWYLQPIMTGHLFYLMSRFLFWGTDRLRLAPSILLGDIESGTLSL